MRPLLSAITILIMSTLAINAAADGVEFYKGKDEGWFWYHDPEILPEPEPEEEQELPPAPPPPETASTQSEEPKGPPSFSVQWYQENMEQVLNRAIDNPTDENVAAYFFIHRLMMDKANQFAVKAKTVAMDHPELDERTRSTGGGAAKSLQEKQKKTILSELTETINGQDGAIWFWYNDDVYSRKMARVLRGLRDRTGIQIVAFSVTGNPLKGEAGEWFSDYVVDSGYAAKKVGVSHTPAVALALPPDRVQLLAHGLIARSEIENRMVVAAERLKVLDSEKLNIYQGRNPGAGLIDVEELPEIEGNNTEDILEVMGEMFDY